MLKNTQETFLSCSVQKTGLKKILIFEKSQQNIRQNRNFFIMAKNGHNAKAIAFAKLSMGQNLKFSKKSLKNTLETFLSCSVQKTALKNS